MSDQERKVGDWVEWVHYGRGSMTRTAGPIHEIKGDQVRVRRGKNGKKDYWIPISELITKGHDPLKSFVSALAEAYREKEKQAS